MGKPYNRPAGEEMQSPFGGWRHHLARWEACHWIRGSRGSPMNPVPLPPPQFGGATKGKRLNGQARRLTSPHLEVLCRTSTGDNNPCLLQSRLRREASRCFILPPEQGEVRRSWIGGGERSEPISRMLIMPYDTVRQARNADFMFIARKGDTTTLGPKGRQTYEPSGP